MFLFVFWWKYLCQSFALMVSLICIIDWMLYDIKLIAIYRRRTLLVLLNAVSISCLYYICWYQFSPWKPTIITILDKERDRESTRAREGGGRGEGEKNTGGSFPFCSLHPFLLLSVVENIPFFTQNYMLYCLTFIYIDNPICYHFVLEEGVRKGEPFNISFNAFLSFFLGKATLPWRSHEPSVDHFGSLGCSGCCCQPAHPCQDVWFTHLLSPSPPHPPCGKAWYHQSWRLSANPQEWGQPYGGNGL